jgi:alanine racemase
MTNSNRLIDLNKYKSNIQNIRKSLKVGISVMAVVKANAYGHGSEDLAKASIEAGASYLAVATENEAQSLIDSGIKSPILLLSEFRLKSLHENIAITVFDSGQVDHIIEQAKETNTKVKVHLKVDTGMHRLGISSEEIRKVSDRLKNSPNIIVEGLMTHLSTAASKDVSEKQSNEFLKIISDLEKEGPLPPIIHMTNSIGTEVYPQMHFNMVRLGMAAYENVMTVKTSVITIRNLKKGDSVGYESDYCLKRDSTIAVLKIGYADGLPLNASKGGCVEIKGSSFPIVGIVCMDMIFVDLGDNKSLVNTGDIALISPTHMSSAIDINFRYLTCMFDRPRCQLST